MDNIDIKNRCRYRKGKPPQEDGFGKGWDWARNRHVYDRWSLWCIDRHIANMESGVYKRGAMAYREHWEEQHASIT